MTSLYEVFRLIFGLIVAGFIFVILINFISSYASVQESINRAEIMRNFLKTGADVYLTGNPVGFTQFGKADFSGVNEPVFETTPPEGILSSTGKSPVYFPLFFALGDEVFIDGGSLDMGWWTFRYVTAMPQTRIFFSPQVSGQREFIRSVVSHFPNTEFFSPTVSFGICDGSEIRELCGGSLCEQRDFIFSLQDQVVQPCTVPIPENAVLVTIARTCTEGLCLTPADDQGVGTMLLDGETYFYKDPLDVVAAVIGQSEDRLGSRATRLVDYKNAIFRREILLAVDVMMHKGQLYRTADDCGFAWSRLITTMRDIKQSLDDEDYHLNQATIRRLIADLTTARGIHEELVNGGCGA